MLTHPFIKFGSWDTRVFFLFISVCLMAGSSPAFGAHILIKASARKDYVRAVDEYGNYKPETCVFLPGAYHEGAYSDKEPSISVEDVMLLLSEHLASQSYVPTNDQRDADLLLYLRWGQTEPLEDEFLDFGSEIDSDGNSAQTFTGNDFATGSNARVRKDNSQLIGAASKDSLSYYSLKRRDLEDAVDSERYFINIIAFSVEEMRARDPEGPMPRPVWTTALSVPIPRNREPETMFTELARVGGSVFGTDNGTPDFVKPDLPEGTVTIGIPEFLSEDSVGE